MLEVDKDLECTLVLEFVKAGYSFTRGCLSYQGISTGIPDHLSSPVTLGTETGIVCVKDVVQFIFCLAYENLNS